MTLESRASQMADAIADIHYLCIDIPTRSRIRNILLVNLREAVAVEREKQKHWSETQVTGYCIRCEEIAGHFNEKCNELAALRTDIHGWKIKYLEARKTGFAEGKQEEREDCAKVADSHAKNCGACGCDGWQIAETGAWEMNPVNLKTVVRAYEKAWIEKALKATGNNAARAAALLGLKSTTMIEKMKWHKLTRNPTGRDWK